MPSKAETILDAFAAALASAAPAGATVGRNIEMPTRVPSAGLLILRDGSPGEPDVMLGPVTYYYTHRAVVDVLAQGADGGDRDARFDTARAAIGAAVVADRTLGGLCDWIEADGSSEPAEVEIQGGDPVKAAEIGVLLMYATTENPLT